MACPLWSRCQFRTVSTLCQQVPGHQSSSYVPASCHWMVQSSWWKFMCEKPHSLWSTVEFTLTEACIGLYCKSHWNLKKNNTWQIPMDVGANYFWINIYSSVLSSIASVRLRLSLAFSHQGGASGNLWESRKTLLYSSRDMVWKSTASTTKHTLKRSVFP